MRYFAYCQRSGVIKLYTEEQDINELYIGTGGPEFLEFLGVRARHGHQDELLVPGVPEADTEDDAIMAFFAFRDQMIKAGY